MTKKKQTKVAFFSFLAGCLLDFLKTDVGRKLKMNKLIDMAAQVSQSENAGHLTFVFGSNLDVFIAADSTLM